MDVLDELFQKCDFYLDINHESEIVSAVYQAFIHDQLIYAFHETLHEPEYVPARHRYETDEADRMIADIKRALEDSADMEQQLALQHQFALVADREEYRKLLI
jgi:hypothetical protein